VIEHTGTAPAGAYLPIAVTSRSEFDESVHFGAAVAVDPDGEVEWAHGDPDVAIYPRSSNKPIQAAAMLRAGVTLTSEQLALACASHDGTERHCAVVRSTLASVGCDESALGNTPDLPLHLATAERLLADGGGRTALTMNCSGKHAAMVATCVVNGWAVDGYLDPAHPLQRAITDYLAELAGGVVHVGVDGCGAPAHVIELSGLARAFGALARQRGVVWSAMRDHPELVGGEQRDVTRLMRSVPGLMAKDGAEGVFAAALPDGRAAAVKIADGASRASGVAIAAVLAEAFGIDVDPAALGEPIRGHGRPVGRVRPLVGAAT
jgi:L-asparaginase II